MHLRLPISRGRRGTLARAAAAVLLALSLPAAVLAQTGAPPSVFEGSVTIAGKAAGKGHTVEVRPYNSAGHVCGSGQTDDKGDFANLAVTSNSEDPLCPIQDVPVLITVDGKQTKAQLVSCADRKPIQGQIVWTNHQLTCVLLSVAGNAPTDANIAAASPRSGGSPTGQGSGTPPAGSPAAGATDAQGGSARGAGTGVASSTDLVKTSSSGSGPALAVGLGIAAAVLLGAAGGAWWWLRRRGPA